MTDSVNELHFVTTMSWRDNTGKPVQMAYSQGEVWTRKALNQTTWDAWKKIFPLEKRDNTVFLRGQVNVNIGNQWEALVYMKGNQRLWKTNNVYFTNVYNGGSHIDIRESNRYKVYDFGRNVRVTKVIIARERYEWVELTLSKDNSSWQKFSNSRTITEFMGMQTNKDKLFEEYTLSGIEARYVRAEQRYGVPILIEYEEILDGFYRFNTEKLGDLYLNPQMRRLSCFGKNIAEGTEIDVEMMRP